VRFAKKHLTHQRFAGTFRVELCTYVYLWEDYDDKEKRRVNKTRTAWVITDMEESL